MSRASALWLLALWMGCGPSDPGEGALVAREGQWTFIPFGDSRCANGSPTGLGVNLSAGAKDVLLYFQGGGACSDGEGCVGLVPKASNIDTGYGTAKFSLEPNLSGILFLSRWSPDNPFLGAQMVFIPYCTGDLHGGDGEATYPVQGGARTLQHRGYRNVSRYLERLVHSFPDAERIFVTGASAGGYGALFNVRQVRAAFPQAQVHLLADSAPAFELPPQLVHSWRTAWNLQLPEDCADCGLHPHLLLEHELAAAPSGRFGLLGYQRDAILAHYLELTLEEVSTRMEALRERVSKNPRARAFVVPANRHVVLSEPLVKVGDTSLPDWLRQFESGAPEWSDAWPLP